jgi:para-aminobenzoate synthetase component 1
MGLYDVVVAFDHQQERAWFVSQGLPEQGPAREGRAAARIAFFRDKLLCAPDDRLQRPLGVLTAEELAPSYATPYGRGVVSSFSREGYLRAVERVVEHLRAGDAFQVNLAQRLLAPDPGNPVAMYLRLRERNPAPFGGYFDGGSWQVVSASPERFLRVDGEAVETRPIKGTRPLGDDAGRQLLASEKDRAENVMIVDLLRNDLARVCRDESVEVPTLFGLERYAHVQHLVSVVTGRLRPECGVADLLAATLPGGSITGAPKVRAQEIIASLEPTARGAYCGALAWIGFPDAFGRQSMDSSVLIRTLTASRGWVQAPVGGGVVVQSDPEAEYEETWYKAAGLVEVIAP